MYIPETLDAGVKSRISLATATRLNKERKTREVAIPWQAFRSPYFRQELAVHMFQLGRPLELSIAYTFPGVQVSLFVTPQDHTAVLRLSRRVQLKTLWNATPTTFGEPPVVPSGMFR